MFVSRRTRHLRLMLALALVAASLYMPTAALADDAPYSVSMTIPGGCYEAGEPLQVLVELTAPSELDGPPAEVWVEDLQTREFTITTVDEVEPGATLPLLLEIPTTQTSGTVEVGVNVPNWPGEVSGTFTAELIGEACYSPSEGLALEFEFTNTGTVDWIGTGVEVVVDDLWSSQSVDAEGVPLSPLPPVPAGSSRAGFVIPIHPDIDFEPDLTYTLMTIGTIGVNLAGWLGGEGVIWSPLDDTFYVTTTFELCPATSDGGDDGDDEPTGWGGPWSFSFLGLDPQFSQSEQSYLFKDWWASGSTEGIKAGIAALQAEIDSWYASVEACNMDVDCENALAENMPAHERFLPDVSLNICDLPTPDGCSIEGGTVDLSMEAGYTGKVTYSVTTGPTAKGGYIFGVEGESNLGENTGLRWGKYVGHEWIMEPGVTIAVQHDWSFITDMCIAADHSPAPAESCHLTDIAGPGFLYAPPSADWIGTDSIPALLTFGYCHVVSGECITYQRDVPHSIHVWEGPVIEGPDEDDPVVNPTTPSSTLPVSPPQTLPVTGPFTEGWVPVAGGLLFAGLLLLWIARQRPAARGDR